MENLRWCGLYVQYLFVFVDKFEVVRREFEHLAVSQFEGFSCGFLWSGRFTMRTDVWFVRFFRAAGLGLLATGTAFAIAAMGATAQTAPAQAQVTFTKDVAPIFYRSCVRCHRPDEIAPMSLLTYNDARPWARAIKERVSKREMPPWFLDKTLGIQKYQNDPSLTDEEIATIARWVDGARCRVTQPTCRRCRRSMTSAHGGS